MEHIACIPFSVSDRLDEDDYGDSHADLGLGCSSSDFLQSAFLTLPVETRRRIRDDDEGVGISIGDYLLWAAAYKMVSKITYCANPNGDKNVMCGIH